MDIRNYIKAVGVKLAETAEKFSANALLLEAAGHQGLATQFETEANDCRQFSLVFKGAPQAARIPVSFRSVRRCFEEMLGVLQIEIVPLINRALNVASKEDESNLEASLSAIERQLDWIEAQLFSIKELGEENYLNQLKI